MFSTYYVTTTHSILFHHEQEYQYWNVEFKYVLAGPTGIEKYEIQIPILQSLWECIEACCQ